jgi:hypothetical protein
MSLIFPPLFAPLAASFRHYTAVIALKAQRFQAVPQNLVWWTGKAILDAAYF